MPNTRDRQRDDYVFYEKRKGRTNKDIADELGLTQERIRQIYYRACRDRREKYFRKHPEARKEWWEDTKTNDVKFLEAYMKEFEGEA